jgi:hypothetical protein
VEAAITDGPETVPGAAELIAAGFEPIESLTGAVWVATVWPEEHRRTIPETRPGWLDEHSDGLVWFVRSPWPDIAPSDVLSILWVTLDWSTEESEQRTLAAQVLSWTAERARAALPTQPPP